MLLGGTGTAFAQGFVLWQAAGVGSDSLGTSVANAGDLNGDGIPDFLIGAPQPPLSSSSTSSGYARVLSGVDGGTLLTVPGAGQGNRFGRSVASAGDVDGDGVPDLLVGATEEGSPGGPGYARVHSGATGGLVFNFPGTINGERFGWSVAGPGDLDGDGVPDLVVGTPQAGYGAPGRAVVFSGANGSILINLSGNAISDWFGSSIAAVGDASGDGVPDFLVGAPHANPTPLLEAGRAFLFSGSTLAPVLAFDGSTQQEQFGAAVAGSGDLDGDGAPDLVVGAPLHPNGTGMGRVRVFSGSSGAPLLDFTGTVANGRLGTSVASSGDVNSDGIPDILAGGASGPPSVGQARIYSGAGGTLLMSLTSSLLQFGAAVAGAGDLNADGYGDFLVAAPGSYSGGIARAFSFTGIPPGSTLFGSGCSGSGGFAPQIRTVGLPTSAVGSSAFGILLSQALGGTTAVLIVGFSFQTWGSIPLPLDLGPLGAPGCALYASADVVVPTSSTGAGPGAGGAFVPMAIPPMPSLLGSLLHFQWYVFDPGPLVVPGAMSPALQLLML